MGTPTRKPRRNQPETPRKRVGPDGEPMRNVRYSHALMRAICARLAEGGLWQNICREPGMPAYGTFYEWQKRYPEFAEGVKAAREAGADYCADRALAVAETSTKDTVSQDRLLVSTLMQRAEALSPQTWGGKAAPAPKAEPVQVVFYMRRFEKAVGPDGKVFVRELPPEDEA